MERINKFGRRLLRSPALLLAWIVVLSGAVGFLAYQKFLNSESLPKQNEGPPDVTAQRPSAGSQTITGQASVIDGDTIEIHGTRIRLHGIDAPESSQTCTNSEGKEYRCGQRSANALDDKIRGRTIECRQKDIDRYSRVVAVCLVGGEDINAWMVDQGWAIAYRQFSTDYVSQERNAANSKIGIWQGKFELPSVWRSNHPDRRPAFGNSSSTSQRPTKSRGAFYYPPGNLSGTRYLTMTECEQAWQQAGSVGICVMK